jgi:hypothetical protein
MASLATEARARLNPQLVDVNATLLTALLTTASDIAERYCGRVFAAAERTETYSGNGTNVLFLRCYPVTTVTTINSLDDDAVATAITTGNRVNTRTGELRLIEECFPSGFENVTVKYTAGFATIPEAVQEAVVQIAAKLNAEGLHDPSLSGETLGDYSYQAAPVYSDALANTALGQATMKLLAPYRSIHV